MTDPMAKLAYRPRTREAIAQAVAADIPDGWHVNLGVGMPTLVADRVPAGREVVLHSENGILGMGPAPAPGEADRWLVNAGKQMVTLVPGASLFDHSLSFAMIRGGHIDLCVLGAFEVSDRGDIANWTLSSNDKVPAVGGAMDLAAGAKAIWVMTEHVTRDGAPKLVTHCSYPLTAAGVVRRIYTDLCTLDITKAGFRLVDMIDGLDFAELQAKTGASILRD